MKDRFFVTELEIPKGVPGISDLFKNVRLCNNGSLIVCYRETVIVDAVNLGEATLFRAAPLMDPGTGFVVPAGAMLALDMRRIS